MKLVLCRVADDIHATMSRTVVVVVVIVPQVAVVLLVKGVVDLLVAPDVAVVERGRGVAQLPGEAVDEPIGGGGGGERGGAATSVRRCAGFHLHLIPAFPSGGWRRRIIIFFCQRQNEILWLTII